MVNYLTCHFWLIVSVGNGQKTRRNLGAHYTSEENILKLIRPLFLDDLQQQFKHIKQLKRGKQKQLIGFQQKISQLQFLDPACGCGNFLIITYRELRRLELALLEEQQKEKGGSHLFEIEPLIHLNYFHGIEIEEWPVRIAEVAMWLTQHQMNREFAKQFGHEPDLLPLKIAAHIVHGNALQLDWESIVPVDTLNYVMGNPPFLGKNYRSTEQNQDMENIFKGHKNFKSLDFVCNWFLKAARFIKNTPIKAAFVSTNSITMGEQVAPLWKPMLAMGIHIHFAHRTFSWESEAKGKAAVHVVIIGFADFDTQKKVLFDYADIKGEAKQHNVTNINPYLIESKEIVIESRTKPLSNISPMVYGNKPVDGGHLLLSPEEKKELIAKEPKAEKWIRPLLGAEEFINGKERLVFMVSRYSAS